LAHFYQLLAYNRYHSRSSVKTRIQLITVAFALCCTAVFADGAPKASVTPVEAQLLADVRAHQLKVGQPVYARVDSLWNSESCTLKRGAILEGYVVAVTPHTKTDANSMLTLAFTKAQCSGLEMDDLKLLLSAVAGPPLDMDRGFLSDMLPIRSGNGGDAGTLLMSQGTAAFPATQKSASMIRKADTEDDDLPRLPPMKMGDVVGIRGLKLSVGSGPDHSTVLTAANHDLTLISHTVFLLVPVARVVPAAGASVPSGEPAAAGSAGVSETTGASLTTAPAPPPVNDIDVCVPPQCDVALPPGNAPSEGAAPYSISISQLGYGARAQRVMNSFDHDEELAYLGPHELLVAFNPHGLLSRHELGTGGVTKRVIRAAVVDTATRRVTHTADWELPDQGQHLWPLADGRVLVHVGSELRVYGAGLKIQNRLGLTSPLDFVRVTPDGSFIAVGVIHERHSAELHAQLRGSLGAEPEEDVDILVLNRKFEAIAKAKTRSSLLPPTLLNEGQVRLLAQPEMRYRILMQDWDNRTSTFARFESGCTPDLSSIAPDLIFMVSCAKQSDELEYRVLQPNGKLVMKSMPTLSDFGFAAAGSANHEAFAVKTVQSTRPVAAGVPFSAADFSSEALGVYRAADGKRLLSVVVGSPSSSRDGFALAPDGSQLAVLNRDQIQLYSVPQK
jgi:hypothetical protein